MLSVSVRAPRGNRETCDDGVRADGYWNAKNHEEQSYLRAEHWRPDVEEFCFPTKTNLVKLQLPWAQAILRYREELKMYAALHDEHMVGSSSMEDPQFLDAQHERILREWPAGSATMRSWWSAIEELRQAIDAALVGMHEGAFIKLSVRSPKDAALCLSSTYAMVLEGVRKSELRSDSSGVLSENVAIVKRASWLALRVRSGSDAVALLVRSERAYLDILQHELFNMRGCGGFEGGEALADARNFEINVHVTEFFSGFDPDWEFRYFVVDGQRTGLTTYNPWVFVPAIVAHKKEIFHLIENVINKVQPKIHSQTYSIDFAVSPQLDACWVVEVNNFVPPLAGAGLFDTSSARDCTLLRTGPFEFRVRDAPVTESEMTKTHGDIRTGTSTTVQMQPAPPRLMHLIDEERRRARNQLLTEPESTRMLCCLM